MKLTAVIQLTPTDEQATAVCQTLETANAACNAISRTACQARTFKQFGIHKLTYYDIKATFDLAAQLVVRCIAKVADAYKLATQAPRAFQPHGAVAFDDRILRYGSAYVSIWTVAGRQTIPFMCGERQRQLLQA